MDRPVRLRPRTPLSSAQEPIWTSQRLHPDVPLANMASHVRFDGDIDPDRFIAAFDAVVASSDALRTVVSEVDGQPYPTIVPEPPRRTEVVRLSVEEFDEWMRDRISRPLDISACVYDSVLAHHDDSWSWWIDIHHIATDAASQALVFQAVGDEYHGVEREPGASYVDFTAERELAAAASERWQKAKAWWEERDHDRPPTTLYAPDRGDDTRAERIELAFGGPRRQALDDLLAGPFRMLSADLSLTVALATALTAYLHRLNGSDAVSIGLPIHHRSSKESKRVIGPLVELFPLDVSVGPDETFSSLRERIGAGVFELLGRAEPGTSPRQTFDVVLNVHAATFGSFGSIPTSIRWVHSGHIDEHHRLRVQALDYDGRGELQIALDMNHRAADADHRRRAVTHFGVVLDAMCSDPDRPLRSVNLLSPDERLLLRTFTDPGPGTPIDTTAPDLVRRQLRSRPDHQVLTEGDDTLTRSDLDQRIDDVARRLAAKGIGRGHLVGIEMPIGTDAVVAIHGVQRAGAAFVPIDPDYPEPRRDHLRIDSGASVVLRSLDDLADVDPVTGELPEVEFDDLAYVIYTSGSTGLPKGVPITHRGLAEYVGFAYAAYVNGVPPVMPLYTSLSFDLTITTLYLPLIAPGRMTIHPDGGLPALREIVDQREVTLLKATPSHLELLVRMIDDTHPLRGLIVGGEAFLTDLADRLLATLGPDSTIWNEYGPTEAVVGCMLHLYDPETDPGPEVPIGLPAPGVTLHVLDSVGHPVPMGAIGELFIGRPGLTSGYLGRPELNRRKFLPTTGPDGSVLYRTGDLVRLLDADRMVYLGRVDTQIKIGGIRTEAGEIESAALAIDGVQRAVASLWHPDPERSVELCVRCGLGSDVPDVTIDADGVCSACHSYDLVAPQAESWFRTEDDLVAELADARLDAAGDYDVLHLLSGGKDSTYALYRLVEMGARVFALTLDNGFISEGAKDNVRRATEALGVDHEFVTVDGMNEIFRDSLQRFSNVCQGCYKTIYTLALRRAEDLGIPAIVTGLSRGQFFETRLVPGLFEAERFDPEAIDAAVDAARRVYHTTPDAVSEHLDTTFLADGTVLDRVRFIDFFRYVDVPLSEMYEALEGSGTWMRPADTGRSTNCLINSAGIHVHKTEQAHHNYALPYSWDVRLGHKTREEALFELDDPMDDDEMAAITSMLAEVGYEPQPAEVLTLWIEPEPGAELDVDDVRTRLANVLPSHAVPQAIETIDAVPLTPNGKVDLDSLPAPMHRRVDEGSGGRPPAGDDELAVAAVWEHVLGRTGLGADDDFFAIGGTSLHALEMIVRVSDRFGRTVPEALAFRNRTIASLATAIAALDDDGAESRHAIEPLAHDERPLSAGEEAMAYEWRRDPDDRRYNVGRLYRLPPDYDSDRLDDAIRAVVAHQPTLHTAYDAARTVLPVHRAVSFERIDVGPRPIAEVAAEIHQQTFDIVSGPLLTVHHLRSDVDVAPAVLVRTHHISSDAGSFDVLWEQIDLAYSGSDLPAHATTYAAHGAWQRERRPDPLDAWPVDADTQVGQLAVHTPAAEPDGYVHRSTSLTASVLRQAPGTTPFATALTALAAAIEPYHSSPRFELAVTSSVRDHPDLATITGYFLNTLPLVVSVDSGASGRDAAREVSDLLARSLEHRAVPFGAIVAAARDAGIPAPTSQVMLAVEDLAPASLDGDELEHEILASGSAVNDLTFFVQLRGERIELGVEYRGAAVSRQQAQRLLEAFEQALHRLAAEPDRPIADPSSLPEPLRGPTIDQRPPVAPLLLATAITEHPERRAIRSGDRVLTYAQLDEAGRALAARLRAVGVGTGDRVAVVIERSVDLPVAIWATWLLGASYVPIDVAQPPARVSELVASAGVRAAIAGSSPHAGLGEVTTVRADLADAAVLPLTGTRTWAPDDEAYVIFTSGSTGRPKGVPVSHGNLAWSLGARLEYYEAPVERYLLLSSAGFDSSVAGLFWTLADGGELLIPTEDQVHDVDALLELIERYRPSHTLCVPSLYGALLQRHGAALPGLQTIIVAGEACPAELVERHLNLGGGDLVNEYGPTEATVWATAQHLDADAAATVPIGGPIPGVLVDVRRPDGMTVPIDVAGELVIAGPTVVAAYLDAEEPADGPFVAYSVRTDGHRAYRTGDRVVRRHDGTLEFLGRTDEQLSVGGVRIEPAELEQALTRVSGVRAALVGTRSGQLFAWVEADEGTDPAELRLILQRRFAPTHVPRTVFLVDELPRTANGKIDRHRVDELPVELPSAPSSSEVVDDDTLAAVVDIYVRAFDGQSIGPDDDFFELGGDSLRAVVLVSLLEERFDRRVGIGELVDMPTPRLLAPTFTATDADAPTEDGEDGPAGVEVPFAASDTSGLVEWLRRAGSARPLVVLPPGGGNLLRYAPMVRALDADVPVVGVRLPGADARSAIVDSIAGQARWMLAALDDAGVTGPYRLLGWSTGGLIAWEMAHLLRRRGDEVELVALVDSVIGGRHVDEPVSPVDKYRRMVEDDGVRAAAGEGLGRLRERAEFSLARRRYRVARREGRTPDLQDAERQLGPVIRKASLSYQPSVLSDVEVLYFAASESGTEFTVDPWTELQGDVDGFHVVALEGTHFLPEDRCIIGPSKAPELVVELERRLR